MVNDMAVINKKGNSSVKNLSLSQEKNQKVVQELISNIYSLLEKAQMIGKVLDILHGITKQTELLSFNAMIVASHAGEHGKVFKIVTMDFTKDIENAIKGGLINSAIAQRAFSCGTLPIEFLDKVFQGKAVQKYVDTGTYEVNLSNLKIYEGRV